MMYASQSTTLYTLNFYSAVCQLYLSKTGREKKKVEDVNISSLGNGKGLSPRD